MENCAENIPKFAESTNHLNTLFMKHLFFIPLAAVLLTFSSCKKNEACIDGPSEVIVGSSVTYSFCGEGKNVTWNVYDGISTEEYEGEEITITFEMATEFAQIQLQADGGMLKGDDDVILAVKVSHGGYKLKITDSQFSNGNTNIETIAGATVDLYPSNTCWESEASSCLIASGTADNSGVVLFEGLDAGTYVADVRGYDVHANWSSNVRDMEVTFEESDLYTDYHDQVYVALTVIIYSANQLNGSLPM
ncbi:MAG: hypothetical protein HQ500_01855 [Flavobacteriales bacterium]|nr:hypothetical protein [Flavobacteriales bacterium]